jgi:hypothetical protein
MSRYPDTDPATVLSPDDQGLLTSALAVDQSGLPDSVWEHMLAVVTGEPVDDGDDGAPDDDLAVDGADDVGWVEDPAHEPHDLTDPDPGDPAGYDPFPGGHDGDHHDGDGGAV